MMIREAKSDDIQALTYLMGELGYPTEIHQMKNRMERIYSLPYYRTLVAEIDGNVIGMIGMHIGYMYENDNCYIRVVALVVDNKFRGQGVGYKLISEAENWAKQIEASSIVLNSGNRKERENAHDFYLKFGFSAKSTGFSKVYITSAFGNYVNTRALQVF